MATNEVIEVREGQVYVQGPNGDVKLVNSNLRANDEGGKSELERFEAIGYKRYNPQQGQVSSSNTGPSRSIAEGTSIAQSLYSFLPDAVIQEFAKAWVK